MAISRMCARGEITMNEWVDFKKHQPKEGQKILAVHVDYPAFYWMGEFKPDLAKHSHTDEIEWWLPLPEKEPWEKDEK